MKWLTKDNQLIRKKTQTFVVAKRRGKS